MKARKVAFALAICWMRLAGTISFLRVGLESIVPEDGARRCVCLSLTALRHDGPAHLAAALALGYVHDQLEAGSAKTWLYATEC